MNNEAPAEAFRPNKAGMAAVILGGAPTGIAVGTISVMLPSLSDAFGDGTNGLAIKMVATGAGLGMMLGSPLGGYLSDRWGKRPMLAATTLLFVLAGCGMMLASDLWQIIGARFIVGFCAGTMSVCYLALIGDWFSGEAQGRWLGFNSAAATFILLLLNPLAGALTDTGWRNGFLIYALALPMLLLIFAGVPKGTVSLGTPDTDNAQTRESAPFKMPWAATVLAVVVGTIATGTMLYWPFRLREIGVTSARDLGLYVLPNMLLVGLAGFSYGFVRRYLSISQVFAFTGLCSATGLAIIALAPNPGIAAIGLATEGVAIGLMTPNLSMFAIGASTPQTRARVLGAMKGVYFGSPFVTQFALEALSQRHGPSCALLAIASLSVGLALLMVARRWVRSKVTLAA